MSDRAKFALTAAIAVVYLFVMLLTADTGASWFPCEYTTAFCMAMIFLVWM
jgi:hypothetical protein